MWFSFAGYLSLLSFGLLFEEMGLIIKYHGIVMKIKWASDLGRYIDRTINGTLKWSINLKKIYVSLIKLTFIRHLYGGPLPSALSILFMLMFIILWNIYLVVESLSCVWLFVTPWTAAHQASYPSLSPRVCSTPVHWIDDASQLSHPLSPPSPPGFNLSQHQGLFQWVSSSYQVAKILELQLQHQSFQWIFGDDFL